ncbi:dihydrofolate reductase family protein [Pararhizobium mangrovi]|uniref:Dihydrofolate reductase n=1 Tax=Pararhizobium mangrovi TaxID=2590452 RepID=A0A506U0E0_9HYPH|nr:dihydrofolate reductase family protein [Pararhizobium mangrovi]TPW26444.1 dihydrofolate reductase [Pararhizobium mangrovi]
MRHLVAGLFQSLDGVVQAPGGPDEDRSGGFAHGGWTVPHFDEETGAFIDRIFSAEFALLLGKRTYDIFAAYWPHAGEDQPLARAINAAEKFVLTHSSEPLAWHNSHRVADFEAIAALKQTDGPNLLVQGSSTLYPGLIDRGLIDRLFLLTFPVILGHGKRALADAPAAGFRLEESAISPSGVTIGFYAPSGPVETGSFDLPEPSNDKGDRP